MAAALFNYLMAGRLLRASYYTLFILGVMLSANYLMGYFNFVPFPVVEWLKVGIAVFLIVLIAEVAGIIGYLGRIK